LVEVRLQCCQLSDFVAIFSEYSDPPSDKFSKKRLATNLVTFSGVIRDFWRLSDVKSHIVFPHLNEQRVLPAVGPTPSQITHR